MTWYLAAANMCVLLTLFGSPKRGWDQSKVLISLVLVVAGELTLLLGSAATTLTFAVTALCAGVLMLAEMTRGLRLMIAVAWMTAGALLIALDWEKSAIGEWARHWRPWIAGAGFIMALAFGVMAWQSERLARGKYGDLGGV